MYTEEQVADILQLFLSCPFAKSGACYATPAKCTECLYIELRGFDEITKEEE